MKTRLNLGCGKDYRKDYLNVDNDLDVYADTYMDLNKRLPLKGFFEEILCSHIIEHLYNRQRFLREMYKFLDKKGKLIIKVPHFSVPVAFSHYQHKNFWGYNTIIDINNEIRLFEIEKIELRWKMPIHPISKIINFIINLNPNFSERYIANYIGGFEEIYIELIKGENGKNNNL